MSDFNPFAALEGNNSNAVADPSKKKKAKKKNKPAEPAPVVVAAPEPPAKKKNKAPKAPDNDGFEEKVSQPSKSVSADALTKSLENTASNSNSTADRLATWKDWRKQANAAAAKYGKGPEQLTFKQVLHASSALEYSVEGCFTTPLPAQHEGDLQDMLLAVLPPCGQIPQALASTVVQLGELLGDTDQKLASLGKEAVLSVIRTVKQEPPKADDWMPKVQAMDREASIRQKRLQELEAADQASTTGERARYAIELFKVNDSKLALLSTGSPGSSGAGAPSSSGEALLSLQQFATVAGQQLARAKQAGDKKPVSPAVSLKDQAQKIAMEIKAVERQLAQLKLQAQKIESQRDALASGKSAPAAWSKYTDSERYTRQGKVVDSLEKTLNAHLQATSPAQSSAAKGAAVGAIKDYLASFEVFLKYKQVHVVELAGRLVRLAKMAPSQPSTELKALGMEKEQQAVAQKTKQMVATVVTASEEAAAAVKSAKATCNLRSSLMSSVPGVGGMMAKIDQLVNPIASITTLIKSCGDNLAGVTDTAALEGQTVALQKYVDTYSKAPAAAPAEPAPARPTSAPVNGSAPATNGVDKPDSAKPKRNRNKKGKGGKEEGTEAAPAPVEKKSEEAAPAPAEAPAKEEPKAPAPAKPAPAPAPAPPARKWGVVQNTAPVNEDLPSLADSMAASGKKKGR